MSPKKDANKTTASSSMSSKKPVGLSAEEKAAAREYIKELKAQARADYDRAAGEKALQEKIAEMPKADRVLAERIHKIVTANAPELTPKTWYGMPAYANQAGKIICFFQAADKFKARYATFGFDQAAMIDEGSMWPTSFALIKLTPADEAKIAALVKKAVS
jgi:uncharacterized protein YdhG (YjbR/CyaY superfamily)